MRFPSLPASLLAACLAVAPGSLASASPDAPAAATATRTFEFTYRVKVPRPPEGGKRLDAWVPTPFEDDIQSVQSLRISASLDGTPVPFAHRRDREYGNRMVHVGLDAPGGELVIEWTATITRAADEGQGRARMNPRFLQGDRLVPLEGPAQDLARELGVDAEGVVVRERARKIYDHVLTTMQYDKAAEGWGKGDFIRACTVGKGNCTDFHAKFTGIARASRIPVRFTMGIPITPEPAGKAEGYHCWAHWKEGRNWRPVDISEAQKVHASDPAKADWFFGHLDPDRVALTVGRDLTLVPPQAGPPLLFFGYPHVEVDGVEFKDPDAKANRSFTWRTP